MEDVAKCSAKQVAVVPVPSTIWCAFLRFVVSALNPSNHEHNKSLEQSAEETMVRRNPVRMNSVK